MCINSDSCGEVLVYSKTSLQRTFGYHSKTSVICKFHCIQTRLYTDNSQIHGYDVYATFLAIFDDRNSHMKADAIGPTVVNWHLHI